MRFNAIFTPWKFVTSHSLPDYQIVELSNCKIVKMTQQQAHARHLFFEGRKSIKEIAIETGVSEDTLYDWIHQLSWLRLREAAVTAPAIIADNLCSQIIAFQNAISAREEGQRFPTPQEISLQCKLINCLDKLKKYPNKGQSMQAITGLIHFMEEQDDDLAPVMWAKYEEYMQARSASGYKPYNIEAGPIPFVYAPPPVTARQPDSEPDSLSGEQSDSTNGSGFAPTPMSVSTEGLELSGTEVSKPPFPVSEFEKYKNYFNTLFRRPLTPYRTVHFMQKDVNARWLEYNLFQYCLPEQERRFIQLPKQVIEEIDYDALKEKISKYFEEHSKVAA